MEKQNDPMTLYDQIGGKGAVDKAVEVFYDKVLADDLVSHFFTDVDMKIQIEKQRSFLTYAFGGPVKYTGKDLRNAHSRLVSKGLGNKHFDAVAQHLQSTLVELKVSSDLIDEVMKLVGGTRSDVLGR